MKDATAILRAEYKVYVHETRTTYKVGESGDSPTLTEIIQSEENGDKKQAARLVIENKNLLILITALMHRYEDCKRDPDANA